jgi:hypothetical protein
MNRSVRLSPLALVLGLVALSLATGTRPANAAVLSYPGPAPCDTTLQACIDSAADGSTIDILTDGPIGEELFIDDQSVTLEAGAGFHPVIQGEFDVFVGVSGTGAAVAVDGIHFEGGMIYIRFNGGTGNSFRLEHSILDQDQNGSSGVVMELGAPSTEIVRDNVLRSSGDVVSAFTYGSVAGTQSIVVTGNEITTNNPANSNAGVAANFNDGTVTLDVASNVIHDIGDEGSGFTAGIGLSASGATELTANIVGNTIDSTHGGGFDIRGPDGTSTFALNIFNNIVTGTERAGIELSPFNPGLTVKNGYNDTFDNAKPDFFGGYERGPFNHHLDPMYVNKAAGNYRLKASSPLIDAGLVCSPAGLSRADAAHQERVEGGRVDIGAYELGSQPAQPGVTHFGTSAGESMAGTSGRDVLCGMGGDDTISGNGGNDLVDGGGGKDTLFGGIGNDYVYGGLAADSIGGGAGGDRLFGDAGPDKAIGGSGPDQVSGGPGDDPCLNVHDGVSGNDSLKGGPGNDGFRADPRDTVRSAEHQAACS